MTATAPCSGTSALAAAFHGERVTGIEPALSAWEADVLPLNYTRSSARPPNYVPVVSQCLPGYRTGQGRLLACCSLIVTSRPRSIPGG